MKTALTLSALLLVTITSAPAADKTVELNVGDAAPKFSAKDDTGKEWKSSEVVGKKKIVVFFFPAALTGG